MGFGADTPDKEISTLSGGENQTCIETLMLQKPDIIMLDEPANHLDLKMLGGSSHPKVYKGTIIVVSHDRYFWI